MEFDEDYEEIWQKKVKIESQDSSFSHDEVRETVNVFLNDLF